LFIFETLKNNVFGDTLSLSMYVRDDSDAFIASTNSERHRIPRLKQPKDRVMVSVDQVSEKSSTPLAELNAVKLLSCSKETFKPEF
jgi:hypothetical protein